MTPDNQTSLQEVLSYVSRVYRQCKLMVQDAAEALYEETGCYYSADKRLGYVGRPSTNFIGDDFPGLTRYALVVYVPAGELRTAALFFLDFARRTRRFRPALAYGALDPGARSVDDLSTWAAYYCVMHQEEGQAGFDVCPDGPLMRGTCSVPDYFPSYSVVRVPLLSIGSTDDLHRVVVRPLAAMLQGDLAGAKRLLEGVETEEWPVVGAGSEEARETGEDEEEA